MFVMQLNELFEPSGAHFWQLILECGKNQWQVEATQVEDRFQVRGEMT